MHALGTDLKLRSPAERGRKREGERQTIEIITITLCEKMESITMGSVEVAQVREAK